MKNFYDTEFLDSKIDAMGKILADDFQKLENLSPSERLLSSLSTNLEWFLTWAIKKLNRSGSLWCDGVIDLVFTEVNKSSFDFHGQIWVGPEDNVSTLHKCAMRGYIELSAECDGIRCYEFKANYQGQELLINNEN